MLTFLKDRAESFRFAINGIKDILITEHNAKVHAILTVITVLLGWWLNISVFGWMYIILVIALVWIAEAFNTVLEIVIDIVSPQYNEAARRAKDIAAAAVLFASLAAIIMGVVVLGPPLLSQFGL